MAVLTNIGRAKQPLPLPDGTILKPGASITVASWTDAAWSGNHVLREWRRAGLLRVEGEAPAVSADALVAGRAVVAPPAAPVADPPEWGANPEPYFRG